MVKGYFSNLVVKVGRIKRVFGGSFLTLLVLLSSTVSWVAYGEVGSLVRKDLKGGNSFFDVVEIDGNHYFRSISDKYPKVYNFSQADENVALGHIDVKEHVNFIAKWNENLVIESGDSVGIYEVDGINTTPLFFSLVNSGLSEVSIASTEQYLVHVNDHKLTLLETDGRNYELVTTYDPFSISSLKGTQVGGATIGIDQHFIYLGFVGTDSNDNRRVYIQKLSFDNDSIQLIDFYETGYSTTYLHRLTYLDNGRFAFIDSSGNVRLIGERDSGFELLHSIHRSGSRTPVHLTYYQDELWVAYSENTIRSYHVSNASLIRHINLTELAETYFTPILFRETDSGLFVSTHFDFFVLTEDAQGLSEEHYYHDTGQLGQEVIRGEYVFQPIGNRIHQYSVSNDHTLELVEVYNLPHEIGWLNLVTDGHDIWASTGFGEVFHFKLQNERLEQVGYRNFDFSMPDVFYHRGRLYFSRFEHGMVTLDTTKDRSLFNNVQHYTTDGVEGIYSDLGVVNGHLFAIDTRGRFEADYANDRLVKLVEKGNQFDVENFVDLNSVILNLVFAENLIFAHTLSGLQIYRVGDSGHLEPIIDFEPQGHVTFVTADKGRVLIASQYGGGSRFSIYDVAGGEIDNIVSEIRSSEDWVYNARLTSWGDYYYGSDGAVFQLYQTNFQPILPIERLTVAEDTVLALDVTTLDPEKDQLEVEFINFPSNGTLVFDEVSQVLTYTPHNDFAGADSVSIRLLDSEGNRVEGDIVIDVIAVNDPPQASDFTLHISEDQVFEGNLGIEDVDDSHFNIIVLDEVSNGMLSIEQTGEFSYTPQRDFSGTDGFRLLIEDSGLNKTEIEVLIEVTAQNGPPLVSQLQFYMLEDEETNIELPVTDAEGDDISIVLLEHGDLLRQVSISENSLSISPLENANGTVHVKLAVSDDTGLSQDYTITIEIQPVNDLPDVDDITVMLTEDTSQTGDLARQDVDGEALTYQLGQDVEHGSLQLNETGHYSYMPNSGFTGSDGFTYQVSDESGNSVEGRVILTVNAKPASGQTTNPSSSSSGGGGSIGGLVVLLAFLLVAGRRQQGVRSINCVH